MSKNRKDRHRRDSNIELFDFNNKQNDNDLKLNTERRFTIFQSQNQNQTQFDNNVIRAEKLLKRYIDDFDFETELNFEKNMFEFRDEEEIFTTSDFSKQIIFFVTKKHKRFKHTNFKKRNIIFQSIEEKKKNVQIFLKLINFSIDFSIEFYVKNIEQFKISVLNASKN